VDTMLTIALIIMAITLIVYLWRRRGGVSKTRTLRSEYRRLLNMPRDEADANIGRHLESLKDKYPGRSEEWYLEKMIYDLERDR
jgi:hypothetical protein